MPKDNFVEVTVRVKKSELARLFKEAAQGRVVFPRGVANDVYEDPEFLKRLSKELKNAWDMANEDIGESAWDAGEALLKGNAPYWDGVNEQKPTGMWKKYGIRRDND